MSLVRRRRGTVLVLAAALLALFVVRPGVNGLRKRIVASVSLALGRQVDVQWVKLRFLPQPGFDLINFVVHDDPSFSAEPILRAQEVTAVLRLRSLLRGRMEIGRLSLSEPSFNLVRRQDGHWNIESLIDKAAHTETAPTRNTLPERRPVFPYIEADDGRINFKIGLEKKSYALNDADFALWLESDNQWGMRLAAQPVRTDFNLTDTGTLRVNGTWRRSGTLRDTPLKFTFRWDGAQMGELTKLLYGRDMGWRGGLTLSADLSGTPADLKVNAKSSVDDFRRYDIVTASSLRLATSCQAHYSSIEHAISDLDCRSPVGPGWVSVQGRIGAPTGPRTYDLNVTLQSVPMQALVNLARRAKRNLRDDLSAAGTVAASFSVRSSPGGLQWTGSGRTEHFILRSDSTNDEVILGAVPFSAQTSTRSGKASLPTHGQAVDDAHFEFGPVTLTLGKPSSLTMQGWASKSGYSVMLGGQASVQRLLQTAELVGVPVPQLTADGQASFNLGVTGKWAGFSPPLPTGTAQLHSLKAHVPGLSGTVDIRSANLVLADDRVQATSIVASAAGATWEGTLSFPRPCHLLSGCPIVFDLHADSLSSYRLHQWLSPAGRKRPWYRFGERGSQAPSLLGELNATGTLAANRVQIRTVTANRVACRMEVHDGVVHLIALTADVLGGKHHGDWKGNLRVNPPEFTGTGKFEHVALEQLAATMHDGWIAGSAKGSYEFSTVGKTVPDWLASAKGSLVFDMRDGSLPHIVVASGTGPLRVRHFSGKLMLRNSKFELEDGRLESGSTIYLVSGTASAGQKLQMKLAHAGGGYLIEGTLPAPHIVTVTTPDTRAALKP